MFDLEASLHDIRGLDPTDPVLAPDRCTASQAFGAGLRTLGADGIVYPSVRHPSSKCAGLFHPDRVSLPIQGRHLDYHWDCARVDLYRDIATGQTYRVT